MNRFAIKLEYAGLFPNFSQLSIGIKLYRTKQWGIFSIKYSSLTNKGFYPKRCPLKCEESRTKPTVRRKANYAFSLTVGEGVSPWG